MHFSEYPFSGYSKMSKPAVPTDITASIYAALVHGSLPDDDQIKVASSSRDCNDLHVHVTYMWLYM